MFPALFLILATMVPEVPSPAAPAPWRQISRGLEIRTMDGGAYCRKGPPGITVLRVRPDSWRVEPFLRAEGDGGQGSGDIDRWQQRTGAPVVFNASQYYPDRRPMGLFVKEGRNLGTERLRSWKGLLVAEPSAGTEVPRIALLDLEHDPFDLESTPYRVAVQSFMVLDRDGRKRVRRSDWYANRTVLATDRRGRLVVLHTEGAYTLWELADWLHRSDLDLRHAMSLDGGFESQLCVRAGEVDYLSFGGWHADDRGDHSLPGVRKSLPSVIALFPRP